MNKAKNLVKLTLGATLAVLSLSSCLKRELHFEEEGGAVITHLDASPASPIGGATLIGSHIISLKSRSDFVDPSKDWVEQQGLAVRYEESLGRKVCIIEPRQGIKKYVLYLHGGAYIHNISELQYNLLKPFVEDLGYGAIIPDYHLAKEYTHRDAYPMVEGLYLKLVREVGAENIAFMGDSAGGGLALGLAQHLRNQSKPLPKNIILISPWLDVTQLNKDLHKINEPLLDQEELQRAGLAWAGDKSPKHFMISPIYGDFKGLPRLHIFIGGQDFFYADVAKLRERMKRERLLLTVYEYPHMFHVWPAVAFLPESKRAYRQMKDIVQ